jgi:hypothetical protein
MDDRDRKREGLAWTGAPTRRASGGFVDGVGLNRPRPALAVDPDRPAPHGSSAGAMAERVGRSGPTLDVDRIEPDSDDRTRRNGRVRLPKG